MVTTQAARNAEFLDTFITTCRVDHDAKAKKLAVQQTMDAAMDGAAPAAPPPAAAAL